jgi:hypothetical protein
VDVTNPDEVDKAITGQMKEFNDRLDVFVYNSGVAWTGKCRDSVSGICLIVFRIASPTHPLPNGLEPQLMCVVSSPQVRQGVHDKALDSPMSNKTIHEPTQLASIQTCPPNP